MLPVGDATSHLVKSTNNKQTTLARDIYLFIEKSPSFQWDIGVSTLEPRTYLIGLGLAPEYTLDESGEQIFNSIVPS
jgi:hypothetical protein